MTTFTVGEPTRQAQQRDTLTNDDVHDGAVSPTDHFNRDIATCGSNDTPLCHPWMPGTQFTDAS